MCGALSLSLLSPAPAALAQGPGSHAAVEHGRLALLIAKSWPPSLHVLHRDDEAVVSVERMDVLYADLTQDFGLGCTVWTTGAPLGFFWLTRADYEERYDSLEIADISLALNTGPYLERLRRYSEAAGGEQLRYTSTLTITNRGYYPGSVVLSLPDVRRLMDLLGDALRERDSVLVAVGAGASVEEIEEALAWWNEETADGSIGSMEFAPWSTLIASMYFENASRALQNFLVTGQPPPGADVHGRYRYPYAELDPMPAGSPIPDQSR